MRRLIESAVRPTIHDLEISNQVKGEQNITEIPRPYGMSVYLEIKGPAIVIDEQIAIAYDSYYSPEWGRTLWNLFVTRELTQPLKVVATDTDKCLPYRNEEERAGNFGVLYIGLRDERPQCAVGEKYMLTLIAKTDLGIAFQVDSTQPFVDARPLNRQTLEGYKANLRKINQFARRRAHASLQTS